MACDLATTPKSGLRVQACGDAHIGNFRLLGTPERRLILDLNDFDETTPAPFEWDLKRLAASAVVAARHHGWSPGSCRGIAQSAARTYRTKMEYFARQSSLDVWYSSIDQNALEAELRLSKIDKQQHQRAHRDEEGLGKGQPQGGAPAHNQGRRSTSPARRPAAALSP
jgi:uncharacterized protein (DUF2252 family)